MNLFFFQNAYLYLGVGLIFILGSSLLLHMVLFADAFLWVPRHTKDTLFISAVRKIYLRLKIDGLNFKFVDKNSTLQVKFAYVREGKLYRKPKA